MSTRTLTSVFARGVQRNANYISEAKPWVADFRIAAALGLFPPRFHGYWEVLLYVPVDIFRAFGWVRGFLFSMLLAFPVFFFLGRVAMFGMVLAHSSW